MPVEEKQLPIIVEELLKKKEVSGQQITVTEAIQKLERYTSGLSGVKSKPIDYGQTKRAIAILKKAEKEFVVSEGDVYSSPAATAAAKKVLPWIKDNATQSHHIKNLLDFFEKVEKAKKTSAPRKEPVDRYNPDADDSLINTILEKIPTKEPLTKKEITEELEKVAEQVEGKMKIAGKAVSSFVSAWVSGGKSDKCDKLHEHKGKKYGPFPEEK
jgi:hypothetical protein